MTNFLFLFFGCLLLILIIGKIYYAFVFKKEVSQVFTNSTPKSDLKFGFKQLEGLPDPVQRYFKSVLVENQPYINSVRLTHNGQFKTDIHKNWRDIKGEQYFTTKVPSFIWQGKIGILSAKDMYLHDKGKLVVIFSNLFKIINVQGENYNQGELLRWLAESVWFPTNLLPSEHLKWHAVDDNSAKLTFSYKGMELYYIVSFNENDHIYKLETKRIYKGDKLRYWIGECYKYKELNGVKIPTIMKASWYLNKTEYNYALFNIKEIEYEVNKKF